MGEAGAVECDVRAVECDALEDDDGKASCTCG